MTALHSLRQQLADAVNARDVARVREQAADARAAASESLRAASEAAAAEAAAAATLEIHSLRCSLDSAQQNLTEMQHLLQQKDAEYTETLRSAAIEAANFSAVLQQLENLQGGSANSSVHPAPDNRAPTDQRISEAESFSVPVLSASRHRYPQPTLETLLSEPVPSPLSSNCRPSTNFAPVASELNDQQLQPHIAALELQVSTLRDALRDAEDQCSLYEKQCSWFKKMELELQLSQDRNSSASDLDYLRRLVVDLMIAVLSCQLTRFVCSVVVSYMESHDPSVIPAIAQVAFF